MSKRGGRLHAVETCEQCSKKMRRVVKDRYQYLESGLSNVYLHGIVAFVCECGQEVIELPNIERLHTVLFQRLVSKASPLSGSELRFIRKFIGIKAVDFSKMLNVDPTTFSKWETGHQPIGRPNDKLIRLSAALALMERMKQEIEAAYKGIGNHYLDLLNEIRALTTTEADAETVDITQAELVDPPLEFHLRRFPAVELTP